MSNNESPFHGLAEKIRGGKSASTLDLENRKPKLTISRRNEHSRGIGVAGRLVALVRNLIGPANFTILIDDEEVGQIESGEQVTIEVAPGTRTIRIRSLRASRLQSKQMECEFRNGLHLRLYCCETYSGIALYS